MEKIGVTVESERIGSHKSAPEVWTGTEPSNEYRETINRLLDNLYKQFVSEISRSRGITEAQARELIDAGPYTSVQARDAGLIDELIYPDELRKEIRKSIGGTVSVAQYAKEKPAYSRWSPAPTIAIVVAEGTIGDDRGSESETSVSGAVTPSVIRRGFKQALANPSVRGLTFRVNSPGGSALASDLIFHESELARDKRPLTVSFSGVAASGGYYVSCAGQPVFASPATITGSIGIFALKPVLSGLYGKIDLEKHSFQRGANAGIFSLTKPFSDSERERLRSGLRSFYDLFVERVAAGRQLSADSVNSLGEGRVWTGEEAHDNGLVDSIGGLWEALQAAALEAGVEDEFSVEVYPRRRSLFDFNPGKLFSPLAGIARLFVGGNDTAELSESLGLTATNANQGDFFLRLPYDLVIE
jgi:protease-4